MMTSSEQSNQRVAWLFPSLARGFYWHPVLAELTKLYPDMIVFTGNWPGFSPNYEKSFLVKEVGKFRYWSLSRSSSGYDQVILLPSLKILPSLLQFRPKVVVTVAFSLWTFVVLLLKPWAKWKMVIFFEGDSPIVGGNKSGLRKLYRLLIAKYADAFITNSQAGKKYLVRQLSAPEAKIFAKPCEVPDLSLSLGTNHEQLPFHWTNGHRPIFLFVGQLIKRKGISYLLDACRLLKNKGCSNWTLVIIGDGSNRAELEGYTRSLGLAGLVHWVGWVKNENLGNYLKSCDVFVFPTLEDTWGVAVLEAMMFQKPILCSKEAGASEMIEEGGNGFIFDPRRPEILADLMKTFVDKPSLIDSMGKRSGERIKPFTPEATARHLAHVIDAVASNRHESLPIF